MWPVSPPAAICAASTGRTLTPLTLTMGAALLLPRAPFGASSRLVPTFMLRVIPLRRSLCHARSRPSPCLAFLLTPPSLATAVCTSTPAEFLGLGPGSPPILRLLIPMFPPPSFVLLCSAASACLFGITTLLAPCVVRYWTAGETMPSPAVAAATRFCVTTPSVTWCAPLSPLLLLPRPPDLGGPDPALSLPPGFPPPAAAGRRPADVWVPRGMSGFAEAWDFSVSSLLRASHLSVASPTVADVFHEGEARKCAFQGTAAAVAERGATFVPLVLEACGERRGGFPSLFGQSWLGLPPSHALPAVLLLICLETPASGLPSASAAPFTGKTRAQS